MDYLSEKNTVFENHRKSLIQHCERSELSLHCQTQSIWRVFGKTFGQKVLPDRLILIGQKLIENTNIQMRHFEGFLNHVSNRKIINEILPNVFLPFLKS